MNTLLLQQIIQNPKKSIQIFDSGKPWNTTTIMVWVHGNELSGPAALLEILPTLQITSGKVFLIFANLRALDQNIRQTEKNMNRSFVQNSSWNTYEDIRAREIMSFLDQSDYLLDIHNTLNTQNSIPFVISEDREVWEVFDVDFVVSGFDTLHPGGSDGYINSLGKKWVCIECGSIYDPRWYAIAKNSITNFLKFTENTDGKNKVFSQKKYLRFDTIYKNTTLDFSFSKNFEDFEFVRKWQKIATDWQKQIFAKENGYILFPYLPTKIHDEIFCFWREVF